MEVKNEQPRSLDDLTRSAMQKREIPDTNCLVRAASAPDDSLTKSTKDGRLSAIERKRMAAALHRKQMSDEARAQRRFKIGNGKPNVVRDLVVFISIICGAIWLALPSKVHDENGRSNKKHTVDMADKVNNLANSFDAWMIEKVETVRRKDPCDILIGTSSIPNGRRSLFAGRAYNPGDTVLEAPSWFLPFPDQDDPVHPTKFIASYALFLKFHPTLDNIDGRILVTTGDRTEERSIFRATKRIHPGDELFLPFHNHPASLFQTESTASLFRYIPTLADYELADEISKLIKNKAHQMAVAHARRVQGPIHQMETSHLYALGRSIASKFSPVVGDLIPSTRINYDLRNMDTFPSLLSALQNKTLSDLLIAGSCLSDISWPAERGGKLTASTSNHQFERNEVVQVVPIHVVVITTCNADNIQNEQDNQCYVHDGPAQNLDNCWSTPDSLVALCPLTGLVGTDGGFYSNQSTTGNIALSWMKTRNEDVTVDKLRINDIKTLSPGFLALKVVARGKIEVGDEVCNQDKTTLLLILLFMTSPISHLQCCFPQLMTSPSASVADELIPRHWRR